MSALSTGRTMTPRQPNYRLRRTMKEAAALAFAAVLLVWTLTPIYNMVMVSLDFKGRRFQQRHLASTPLAR